MFFNQFNCNILISGKFSLYFQNIINAELNDVIDYGDFSVF